MKKSIHPKYSFLRSILLFLSFRTVAQEEITGDASENVGGNQHAELDVALNKRCTVFAGTCESTFQIEVSLPKERRVLKNVRHRAVSGSSFPAIYSLSNNKLFRTADFGKSIQVCSISPDITVAMGIANFSGRSSVSNPIICPFYPEVRVYNDE